MASQYDYILEQYAENVPVAVAAKLLGKPVAWVQVGLESGVLPFGSCVKRGRAAFHIAPLALVRYLTGDYSQIPRAMIDAVAQSVAKETAKAIMELR